MTNCKLQWCSGADKYFHDCTWQIVQLQWCIGADKYFHDCTWQIVQLEWYSDRGLASLNPQEQTLIEIQFS